MNPKAALLAFATLLTVSPLDSLAQIVPWRGIKNTIIPSHDEQARSDSGISFCGVTDDLSSIFSQLKFRAATNSIPNTDTNLVTKLWTAPPIPNLPPIIEKRVILRRIEAKRSQAPSLTISGNENPARVGHRLGQGDLVKTPNPATMDFFLGDNGPLLHIHENTLLEFTRLDLENTGLEKIIDTRLHLHRGRITGNVKKLAPQSTYLIRTQNNLIRIRGTEYQIEADGTCAIVSGSAEVITPTHIHTVSAGEKYSPDHQTSR